jgi:hypothetical protein
MWLVPAFRREAGLGFVYRPAVCGGFRPVGIHSFRNEGIHQAFFQTTRGRLMCLTGQGMCDIRGASREIIRRRPVLKRVAIVLFVLSGLVSARASVRMEGFGSLYLPGDFPAQYGAGVGASWVVARGMSLYLRGAFATGLEYKGEPNETAYGTGTALAGLRFRGSVPDTPFFWTASTALGGSFAYRQQAKRYRAFTDPSETETVYDIGPTAGA